MRRLFFHLILVIVISQVSNISAGDIDGDLQRLKKLKKIPLKKWQTIANGTSPWPEEIFPISHWSKAEKEKLPSTFWKKIAKYERKWPEYIDHERKLFRKEYGPRFGNIYDIYLHEQREMLKPGYRTPESPVTTKKTLRRLVDVSHLRADYFNKIKGSSVGNIRLFSYKLGKLRIIPFDIIEFTSKDSAVLTSGPEANPKDGDGIFSGNDKLFFMAADAGHRLPVEYISKKYPTVKRVQEIEILYAKDKEKGWVYVAEIKEGKPELSPFDYIVFNPDVSITYTPFCYNQCEPRELDGKIRPTLKASTWCQAPSIGGIPFDVHERLRVRIKLKFVLGSTSDNEDELNVSFRAWTQGRVVNFARSVFEVSTPLGIGAPIVFDDVIASSVQR